MFIRYSTLAICLMLVMSAVNRCSAQEDGTAKNRDVVLAETESASAETGRIERLEKRVAHLERLLFSTAQLSVYDARRRLNSAKETLEQTRRLYLKGMLDRNQIEFDRYRVRRAERELELAQAVDGQFRISAEIDLLEAEHHLDVAKKQLEFSRGLLTRGYVTREQIRQEETALDRAQKAFDVARQKLRAIKEAGLPKGRDNTNEK